MDNKLGQFNSEEHQKIAEATLIILTNTAKEKAESLGYHFNEGWSLECKKHWSNWDITIEEEHEKAFRAMNLKPVQRR